MTNHPEKVASKEFVYRTTIEHASEHIETNAKKAPNPTRKKTHTHSRKKTRNQRNAPDIIIPYYIPPKGHVPNLNNRVSDRVMRKHAPAF